MLSFRSGAVAYFNYIGPLWIVVDLSILQCFCYLLLRI